MDGLRRQREAELKQQHVLDLRRYHQSEEELVKLKLKLAHALSDAENMEFRLMQVADEAAHTHADLNRALAELAAMKAEHALLNAKCVDTAAVPPADDCC